MKEKIFKERNLKTLLSMCFAVAMMVVLLPMSSIMVHAEYHQVTGNQFSIKPVGKNVTSAIVSGRPIQFIEINNAACTPTNVNGYTGAVENALIKVPGGFRYADNSIYDIYIKVTNTVGAATWKAGVGGYISLHVSTSTGYSSYDYEVWLVKAGEENTPENRADIHFVGGSCYMAGINQTNAEYCRPWSSDDNIYASYGSLSASNKNNATLYYDSDKNAWGWPNGNYNKAYVVVFGEGISSDHSIKGGYAAYARNTTYSGEMIFGYVINNNTITYSNGETTDTVSNIPEGQIAYRVPDSIVPEGKHVTEWTANVNLTLNDGTIIDAGNTITTAQLENVINYSSFTLTALNYADHIVIDDAAVPATCTTDGKTAGSHCSFCHKVFVAQEVIPATGHDWIYSANGSNLEAYCANAGCDHFATSYVEANNSGKLVTLPLSASDYAYGELIEPDITYGDNETDREKWKKAGLILPDDSSASDKPSITKTYYNADSSGNSKDGDALGSAPAEVGKYIVDVKVDYGSGKEATVLLPYEITKSSTPITTRTGIIVGQNQVTIAGMKPE